MRISFSLLSAHAGRACIPCEVGAQRVADDWVIVVR